MGPQFRARTGVRPARRWGAECKEALLSVCASAHPARRASFNSLPWTPGVPHPGPSLSSPPPAWVLLEKRVWGLPPCSDDSPRGELKVLLSLTSPVLAVPLSKDPRAHSPRNSSDAWTCSCLRSFALAVFSGPNALFLDTCITQPLVSFRAVLRFPLRPSLSILSKAATPPPIALLCFQSTRLYCAAFVLLTSGLSPLGHEFHRARTLSISF